MSWMKFKIFLLYIINFIEYPLVLLSYALAMYWLVFGPI